MDWDGIDVECGHCLKHFKAPRSMKGGFANCPECGKATKVPGGPEAAFWGLLLLGIALVLGAAYGMGAFFGSAAGWGTFIVGAVIIIIVVVAS